MKINRYVAAGLVILIIVAGSLVALFLDNQLTNGSGPSQTSNPGVIKVVAAENFWGSLVSQLGGKYVNVTSIVTNPNTDPHEYESNAQDAADIANAGFVIVNGAGYDSWALLLISASHTKGQVVLNVQELLNQSATANPHFWYSPTYVNITVKAMYNDLVAIDPKERVYFTQQYAALNASLGPYNGLIDQIREQFNGTKVAATESIFVYMANATGLDLVSPAAFMNAVSEGNDPPAQSEVQFDQLLENHTAAVLVYNEQTVTPLTTTIRELAASEGIPQVGITETVQPPNVTFEAWMYAELVSLYGALNVSATG
ncbi:MAG: zinc ABC transporter substrate-binding protein [Nitrososphaerota archaeon]|jgi:zinc/manganese transport system substrate-binding protein|nr:zinc ABC transporter substrate-binding protein [Nitrososphaerota archaeon]MDG7043420.1 zinc ABC transporter substrate-binding protein [Nitrososphaerota archaeon]